MIRLTDIRCAIAVLTLLLAACAAPVRQDVPVEDRQAASVAAEQRAQALAEAEAALARGDAGAAREYLEAARPPSGDRQAARYQRAIDALFELETDPAGQALARVAVAVDAMDTYDAAGGVALLQAFEDVPVERLESLSSGDTMLSAWAALALSVRRDLIANADLLAAANAWQAAHPEHLVQAPEYMELCWQYRQLFRPPGRIAVLLPQDGPQSAAAAAIRDGLLTGWLDRPGAAELEFLPVGNDPEAALADYLQAAQSGYQWVIGPLQRESTQLIAQLPDPPVPVLLLNDPPDASTLSTASGRRVFSLSLSQQAESRALARHLLDLGFARAIILAADDAWGHGVEAGFAEAFTASGGEVIATARFAAGESDHSEILTAVLRIEDSRQRKSDLQGALGLPLEFEPSRRDDFDVIFLAADPALGRQIKPQLRFFDAGDKPMFAMSRIFSGQINPAADQDLNGVWFAGTRTALPGSEGTPGLASVRSGAFGALLALGQDAWGVLPWMDLMGKDPGLGYPGATGTLRILADGTLLREPLWLQFEQGRPTLPAKAHERQ